MAEPNVAILSVGGGGRGVALDVPDPGRTAALREARAGLTAPDDDDLLVPVLLELAVSLLLTPGSAAERAALVDEALAAARRRDDVDLVAAAELGRRSVALDPTDAPTRLADADAILARPRSAIALETLLATELGRVEDLLVLGRHEAAGTALAHAAELTERLHHAYWSWATTGWQALFAVVEGDLDRAEQLAFAAFEHQAAGEHPEAVAALGVQLVNIRLLQGRAGEVVPLLADAAEANPGIPAYRAVLALCLMRDGDLDGARSCYQHFATVDFANLPADSNRFLALGVLADVCVALQDARGADVLRSELGRWHDRHLVLNCYGTGGAWWGPVARPLAALASLSSTPG